MERDRAVYADVAIAPVEDEKLANLDLFRVTTAAKTTFDKARRKESARQAAVRLR